MSAVIGRESANDKLIRESTVIINGFGDSLMEVICRDACDGLNISRVCSQLLHPSYTPVLVIKARHLLGHIMHTCSQY